LVRRKYPSDETPRPNKERDSPIVPVSIPREVLEQLDALNLENRSAWIVDAIRKKLERQ
jgi:metal-responsive CopG/Arc/MetJ family transcriptional regulator